jgi:hypothetical protein
LLGGEPAIQLVAGLAGLREMLFQLGAPGRLCFQGGVACWAAVWRRGTARLLLEMSRVRWRSTAL